MTVLEGSDTLRSMAAVGAPVDPANPPVSKRRAVPVAIWIVVALVLVGSVVAWRMRSPGSRVVAPKNAAMPVSSAIEQNWGIRFTALSLLADGGLIEVRYQVVDTSKSARIHTGDATNSAKNLPILIVEGTGAKVETRSVMFHFAHASDKTGRLYSIIYGNAGGALKAHTFVTIRLSDGLELQHVPVTN